jgi:hypothetical protein
MKRTTLTQQVTNLLTQADGLTKSMLDVRKNIAGAVIGLDMQAAWDVIERDVLPPIAKKYGAKIERTRTGSCKLVNKDGSRHERAYSFMRTLLSATNLISGAGDTNKNRKDKPRFKTEKELMTQRDFVLKAFKLLSAKDRAWVIKNASV